MQALLVPPPEPSIVAPHREFVLKGSLNKVCRPYPRTKRYTFMLFNDLVIYGIPTGDAGGSGAEFKSSSASAGGSSASGGSVKLHGIITLIGVRATVPAAQP